MSTDLALPSERTAEPASIGSMIQSLRPEIGRALPKGMDADRMARLALTVLRQTPALAQCSPQSFAGSLLTAAALGLEPGVNGEAYLVPYKRECQLIIGYQGMAKLFWQNPLARHLDAQAVHANDEFEFEYGLNPILRHRPANGERGDIIYYYAVATLSTGGSSFVVLTPADVRKLRGKSAGGSIDDPMHWMERKTALRQLIKTLPRSTMLNAAVAADEEMGSSLRRRRAAESLVDTTTGEIHDAEIVEDGDYENPATPEPEDRP